MYTSSSPFFETTPTLTSSSQLGALTQYWILILGSKLLRMELHFRRSTETGYVASTHGVGSYELTLNS